MRTASPTRWIALLTSLATLGIGCAHTPQPAHRVYVISEDATGVGSNLENGTGGAGAEAYCNELQKQCHQKCWRRKPQITSIPKHSEKHKEHCSEMCLNEFMKCVKEQEELERQDVQKAALHFPSIEAALGWTREHKAEVAIGTVIIVAGVVAAPYVIVIMGGALILAPL